MIQFPYGIVDFRRIRRDGMVYVDRTAHIRDLERLGSVLVFLRPRRFGNSLWLQTLATYYDLRTADAFDDIFGGLAIANRATAASEAAGPTALANRYFILQWDFSTVDASGGVREIAESLRRHVSSRARLFAQQYQAFLPDAIRVEGTSEEVFTSLLGAVSQTPYKLYLLIEEYDNFVNEVMVRDVETYHALFGKDGSYRQLFKSVKAATEGQGLERVFGTGVSPVALNDLTSGFNNAVDVSLKRSLAGLCEFSEAELRDLLAPVAAERRLAPEEVDVLLPDPAASYEAQEIALGFFDDGDLAPLLAFFEDKLLPVLSNRDQGAPPDKSGQGGGGVNEMVLKALFLSILFDDQRYAVHSELELERGYADLCLLARPESSRYGDAFDLLFELKLVRRKTLGKKGRELRAMDEAALRRLPAVRIALATAREQVERYRAALVRQRGESVRPRCYAVVAVGLERLLGEEVPALK